MKILVIDDERALTEALSTILNQNKYSVDCAYDGEEGLDYALTGQYDLIILDIMMPKIDGFNFLKVIRQRKMDVPVIVLSAKAQIDDKITGLNFGADDYLTKPFSTEELLARIKALLRRKEKFTGNLLIYNDLTLDRDSFEICKGENRLAVGKKEFQILEMLFLNPNKVINKNVFIEKIWGYDSEAEYNNIEVYVSFIRRKLSALKSSTEIKSVRGVGYTLGEKDV